jgi:hypothetical protein
MRLPKSKRFADLMKRAPTQSSCFLSLLKLTITIGDASATSLCLTFLFHTTTLLHSFVRSAASMDIGLLAASVTRL